MITKLKIGLLGATGVGKTSLMKRFVHSIFSDVYSTTIGVTIEVREVTRGDHKVQLVIWDLSGEDEFQCVQPAYLSGVAGYLVVVDGTRRGTVETGRLLETRVRETVDHAPFVVVVNKSDLITSWEVGPTDLEPLRELACGVVEASARTGAGVSNAFDHLVDGIFTRTLPRWT